MDRVIIVDDEVLFQNSMEKRLQSVPDVVVAGKFGNGQQALEFLEKDEGIDVVFADILMPVMNGLQLARWVTENRPETKVVLISAYQDFSYAQEAIRSGVCHYLNKPVNVTALREVLDTIRRDRFVKLKKQLYHHDLDRERKNQALYEEILCGEERYLSWQWLELVVTFDEKSGTESGSTTRMQTAGILNILHDRVPGAVVVLKYQQKKFHCTLITRDVDRLHQPQQLRQQILELMNQDVRIEVVKNRSVRAELEEIAAIPAASEEITRAIAYIRNNLSREFSRGEVAAAVGLAPSYFSRVFKQYVGQTFVEFVRNERIKRVTQLLDQGYKVHSAAQQAGFKSMNYFYEIFFQVMRCSPTQYKRNSKESVMTGHDEP